MVASEYYETTLDALNELRENKIPIFEIGRAHV